MPPAWVEKAGLFVFSATGVAGSLLASGGCRGMCGACPGCAGAGGVLAVLVLAGLTRGRMKTGLPSGPVQSASAKAGPRGKRAG